MQIQRKNDKYLRVLLEGEDLDLSMLLSWKQYKNDRWLTVEDNLVNRLVLDLPVMPVVGGSHLQAVHDDRLLEHQCKDVIKMCARPKCLNANPMGLGKTVEAAMYLKSLEAVAGSSYLIIAPKIIRYQWQDQLKAWAGLSAEVYEKQKSLESSNIWIINDDKLKNERTLQLFRSRHWDMLIVDEAHRIKNKSSQRTLAVKSLPAARKLALTGTPILRYVDDLWSILNFLDVRYSGYSYWAFVEYFCEVKRNPWGSQIVGLTKDSRKVEVLNKLLDLVCIRNDAVEVAHGKTREIVRLPMEAAQKKLYHNEKELLLDELPEGLTIPNGAVLTLRLMQTTTWPGVFVEGLHGPKFEWILELCQNNPEEKVVVFSVFEKAVEGLKAFLNSKDVGTVTITGKHTALVNERSKQWYLSDPKIQVLAGTIGAMGQGYDELQTVGNTVVFLDRDWSPEIMAQAEDRLHRMGQSRMVHVYYLECAHTFDQHVGRINQNKADDIREALNDEN